MNFKEIIEKQNVFWLILIGIALITFGFYLYLDIQSIEISKGTVRMKRGLMYLYHLGGKFAILAFFETIGIIILILGIKQIKKN